MSDFESAKTDLPYGVDQLPAYAGEYISSFMAASHGTIKYLNLCPQAGSADLIAPRDIGGIPGDSLGSRGRGPNTLDTRENNNTNTQFKRFNTEGSGPVKGGDDYNTGRLIAYQASQIQALTQGESAAAIAAAY